jgi:CMP-N-acetylneuraminic acid synthetase
MTRPQPKRVLGFLPVRGGSKGIPGKNSLHLGGKPLMAWPGEVLAKAPGIDFAFCSTDSEELASIARGVGLATEPLRPKRMASSTSLVAESVRHTLKLLESIGEKFTHVILLQATSPFVTTNDVDQVVRLFEDPKVDSVLSVVRVPDDFHPSLMLRQSNGRLITAGDSGDSFRRRQDRSEWFRRVGLFVGFRVDHFLASNSFMCESSVLVEVESERGINIDEYSDFQRAETYLEGVKNE